jgi:hypothetical protein
VGGLSAAPLGLLEAPYKYPLTGKHSTGHPYTLIDHINVEGKGAWAGLRFRDFNWYVTFHKGYPYVSARVLGRNLRAHQFLTGENDVDHADRDRFNNTSGNLRRGATRTGQTLNHPRRTGCASQYRGVRRSCSGKWQAYGNYEYQFSHFGIYEIEEDAARARDAGMLRILPSSEWEYVDWNFPAEIQAVAA